MINAIRLIHQFAEKLRQSVSSLYLKETEAQRTATPHNIKETHQDMR